jgi:hypothetical protein
VQLLLTSTITASITGEHDGIQTSPPISQTQICILKFRRGSKIGPAIMSGKFGYTPAESACRRTRTR